MKAYKYVNDFIENARLDRNFLNTAKELGFVDFTNEQCEAMYNNLSDGYACMLQVRQSILEAHWENVRVNTQYTNYEYLVELCISDIENNADSKDAIDFLYNGYNDFNKSIFALTSEQTRRLLKVIENGLCS